MTGLPPVPPDQAKAPTWLQNAGRVIHRIGQAEWFGSPFHLSGLAGPKPQGAAASPHDLRPLKPLRGEQIAGGHFNFAGESLNLGVGGDPWDRPNPSRAFAEDLHRLDWLGDLLLLGERGEVAALQLVLDWRRVFGRWNSFAWGDELLERRVFNLACGLRRITSRASDVEAAQLADSLARQARQLLKINHGPVRAAERACAAAVGATALAGEAGERLMTKALARLETALGETVLPDGGHASRSPQAGLELLLDLLTLDDGLSQRGRAAPAQMSRAIDKMASALRVLTLPDGRLACFQGGEEGDPQHIAAVNTASERPEGPPVLALAKTGYERLTGPKLTVIVDAAAPAYGAWAETACDQPLAFEVVCGADRLITNCGWSPRAHAPQALRVASAASTLSIGEESTAAPERGRLSQILGGRLRGGARKVSSKRHENGQGVWLELAHDGWEPGWGLRHERMLYLDRKIDELRGEDRLTPTGGGGGKTAPVAIRFHLHPSVKASLALDRKSVLLQGPTTAGWWLRNDAADVSIEHSVHYQNGQPRHSSQIVLRAQVSSLTGARVRWKLAPVEQMVEGPR